MIKEKGKAREGTVIKEKGKAREGTVIKEKKEYQGRGM